MTIVAMELPETVFSALRLSPQDFADELDTELGGE
jgi:hypothetical protein